MTDNKKREYVLGELLNEVRKEKKVSTKIIFGTGITRPTYYRFVRGDNDITLNNFFKIISVLGLDLSEFEEFSPFLKEGYKGMEQKLINATSNLDYETMKRIKENALQEFYRTDALGYQYVYWRTTILLANLIGDKETYLNAIKEIKQYLNSLDLWTNLELKLFAVVTEELNFEEYKYFFTNFLKRKKNTIEPVDSTVYDLLYLGYYETALDSKNKKNVTEAAEVLLKRTPTRFNYRFRVWKVFVKAGQHYLNGDLEKGEEEYKNTKALIQLLFEDEKIGEVEVKILEILWEKIQLIQK